MGDNQNLKTMYSDGQLWEHVFDHFLGRMVSVEKAAQAACEAVRLRAVARSFQYSRLEAEVSPEEAK